MFECQLLFTSSMHDAKSHTNQERVVLQFSSKIGETASTAGTEATQFQSITQEW
jgi:hypothetical protein